MKINEIDRINEHKNVLIQFKPYLGFLNRKIIYRGETVDGRTIEGRLYYEASPYQFLGMCWERPYILNEETGDLESVVLGSTVELSDRYRRNGKRLADWDKVYIKGKYRWSGEPDVVREFEGFGYLVVRGGEETFLPPGLNGVTWESIEVFPEIEPQP